MKVISALLLFFVLAPSSYGQGTLPESFLDGKSVVLISNSPQARPVLSWENLAEEIHAGIVEAGGDPVAYYELEEITLSEETQAGYAEAFNKRLVKNIVILTRKSSGELILHIAPYTNNKNMVSNAGIYSMQAESVKSMKESLMAMGRNVRSRNLLVLEVPEFPASESSLAGGNSRFLNRNPLNLDVFKLGVPLSGAAGESAFLSMYRYDLLGKSAEAIAAAQKEEKNGLEGIFKASYPHQVEYLTEAKTEAELIKERVQFVLMRVEGRESDLRSSMGLPELESGDDSRIVVKYYIKFLVRNELYIGPEWDADPNWRVALRKFLENLKK
ncbi:NTPase [Belliella sp. R4-6]|uniref:NTPase n=1 Tax=Belliella alkalica TaxID=1730871 RepID=A0ABS9VCH3_9BACT|nr:NTPase [Belliella alkalica]MCH7414140.1 NTPase [Belliella alkalica]